MTRKRLCLLLCLLLVILTFAVYLPVESRAGTDENWDWKLEDGCLTIFGQGETRYTWRPWEGHAKEITSVVFAEGITSISSFTFHSGYTNLTHVTLPNSLQTIRAYAFRGCPNIETVTYRGGSQDLSRLEIKEGNESLQKARWIPSSGYLLLQSSVRTLLTVGADLALAGLIVFIVHRRRLKTPRNFFMR